MTGRRQMRDRDDYIKWLGIVAHEFFHVWNVRHMRPAELAEYDYQHEQYTSQLWLAEGLTSYYDNLLMSRAGLIKPEEYMELLAKDIHRLENDAGQIVTTGYGSFHRCMDSALPTQFQFGQQHHQLLHQGCCYRLRAGCLPQEGKQWAAMIWMR